MTGAGRRALIVEDDAGIAALWAFVLAEAGLAVARRGSALGVAALLRRWRPDVVLLDLGLPDMDGMQVIEGIRGWTSVPIVVLSARQHGEDKVEALDIGADDYVTKPFAMQELLARLRAAVRRSQEPERDAAPVVVGDLVIDFGRKAVTRGGEDVRLTPTEWAFLELLARNLGKLVSREQILREVWGPSYLHETHYLRVYAAQLRRKLEDDPAHPRHLITSAGLGYLLEP
jgi:two-component system KDP operon response regulator KdpE